jgi:hypothetical protein
MSASITKLAGTFYEAAVRLVGATVRWRAAAS